MNPDRLRSDRERLATLIAKAPGLITLERTTGNPPVEYVLTLRCRGLESAGSGGARYRDEHRVRVVMGHDYPLDEPTVEFLTPIMHPHIWPVRNNVCLGSWSVSEFLDLLVIRMFRIIQYHKDLLDSTSVANPTAQTFLDSGAMVLPLGNVIPGDGTPLQGPGGITFSQPVITFRRTS